jgi:type IV fimbrial biogenesis protein FimT
MKCNNDGFTLAELVVTLAVATIFFTLAVPSYYSVLQNNKAATVANYFSANIIFARSEAIKRGVTVTICPTANAAFTACGTAANWINGWIIFVDSDANGVLASTNDRLRVREALPVGSLVAGGPTFISFDSSGFIASGAGTFTVSAAGCIGNYGRQINLANSGRLSIQAAACP